VLKGPYDDWQEKPKRPPEQVSPPEDGSVCPSTYVQLWPARSDSWHGLSAYPTGVLLACAAAGCGWTTEEARRNAAAAND
jgi:hypothetical protein